MIPKAGATLLLVLTLLGLAAIGYWMLFSNFPGYDDEGYIMLSAREYFAHGRLYNSVYSQYGPAFYVFTDIVQRLLGAPVNHITARLLTLGLWLGTAVACAGLVWQQTRAHSLTLFTLAGTFLYLHFMPGEPFHPGTLIVFVLAAALWVLTALISAEKWSGAAIIAGATSAILLLTKVNVGIFFLVAVGAWALLQTVSDRTRRATGIIVGLALVVFAAALMNALWSETWIRIYLALFAAGVIGLVSALRGQAVSEPRHAGFFAATGGLVALVILALIWMRGTSVAGLLEGVLLAPLRHPTSYSFAANWRPGSLPIAGFSLAAALALPWVRRRFSRETADAVVVSLRLVQAVALLTGIALLINFRVIGVVFSYVAPLIWIWAVPLRTVAQPRAAHLGRGLLATVLLLQYLHAYPVGGSQESWGTFLFIPLVALGLNEVRLWCVTREPRAALSSRWWPAFAALIVAVPTAKTAWAERFTHRNYAAFSELGLPGASKLHLPESTRTAYRIITLNAAVHADMLFSLPGMFSFNLWAGLPTPTGKNTTLWFALLTDEEQRAIIEAIERSPRPCIVVQRLFVESMETENSPVRGVLWDYLFKNYTPAFRLEEFVFLVRNGRSIAPLNLARLSRPTGTAPARSASQLDFSLASDGSPIAAIEARDLAALQSPPLVLNAANARVTAVPIDTANHVIGALRDVPWPLNLKGLFQLSVEFGDTGIGPIPLRPVFSLKGSDGQVIGEVRLAE